MPITKDSVSTASITGIQEVVISQSGDSIQAAPYRSTITNRSGTASVTSTQIMAANTSRTYLFIENLDTAIDLHVNFTSSATTGSGSIKIAPGATFEMESGFVSTEAVNLRSASGTPVFTAKEAS